MARSLTAISSLSACSSRIIGASASRTRRAGMELSPTKIALLPTRRLPSIPGAAIMPTSARSPQGACPSVRPQAATSMSVSAQPLKAERGRCRLRRNPPLRDPPQVGCYAPGDTSRRAGPEEGVRFARGEPNGIAPGACPVRPARTAAVGGSPTRPLELGAAQRRRGQRQWFKKEAVSRLNSPVARPRPAATVRKWPEKAEFWHALARSLRPAVLSIRLPVFDGHD